jgi:hypothetical protein
VLLPRRTRSTDVTLTSLAIASPTLSVELFPARVPFAKVTKGLSRSESAVFRPKMKARETDDTSQRLAHGEGLAENEEAKQPRSQGPEKGDYGSIGQ